MAALGWTPTEQADFLQAWFAMTSNESLEREIDLNRRQFEKMPKLDNGPCFASFEEWDRWRVEQNLQRANWLEYNLARWFLPAEVNPNQYNFEEFLVSMMPIGASGVSFRSGAAARPSRPAGQMMASQGQAPRPGATSVAPNATQGTFPKDPGDLLPEVPRNTKGHIQPSDYIRIRPEQHAQEPGETFAPRHHGQHYHVEIRKDPTKSWNNSNNVIKLHPPGYTPGQGTGFLPGEAFPGK